MTNQQIIDQCTAAAKAIRTRTKVHPNAHNAALKLDSAVQLLTEAEDGSAPVSGASAGVAPGASELRRDASAAGGTPAIPVQTRGKAAASDVLPK